MMIMMVLFSVSVAAVVMKM